jgi:arsenate reductase
MFSNTFAGIAPASVPAYVIAQAIGAAVAIVIVRTLYPDVTPKDAATVLLPHGQDAPASKPQPAMR